MLEARAAFVGDGYWVAENIPTETQLACVEAELSRVPWSGVGSRRLLGHKWCHDLASALRDHSHLTAFLSKRSVAVQCTLLEKSRTRNWLVALHQDLSIPVRERVDHPGLSG